MLLLLLLLLLLARWIANCNLATLNAAAAAADLVNHSMKGAALLCFASLCCGVVVLFGWMENGQGRSQTFLICLLGNADVSTKNQQKNQKRKERKEGLRVLCFVGWNVFFCFVVLCGLVADFQLV